MLPELQDKQSMVLSGGYEDDEDHGEWFSTEEMGEEIQVATSDQIRINRSPISINHCYTGVGGKWGNMLKRNTSFEDSINLILLLVIVIQLMTEFRAIICICTIRGSRCYL